MFGDVDLQAYFQETLKTTKVLIKTMSDDDEFLRETAQLAHKLFIAYIDAGFTEEQAFELVSKSDFLKQNGNK